MLIFQTRSFLDCLDGVVFRAHMKNHRYKSYYGDLGYYVDALSDILGGICLVVGCLLCFFRQRPLRLQARPATQSQSTRSSPTSDIGLEETELMVLNLDNEQTAVNSKILETKRNIILALSLFALRYSLSAMFWDRYVRVYEGMLDSYRNKSQRQVSSALISSDHHCSRHM